MRGAKSGFGSAVAIAVFYVNDHLRLQAIVDGILGGIYVVYSRFLRSCRPLAPLFLLRDAQMFRTSACFERASPEFRLSRRSPRGKLALQATQEIHRRDEG